MNTRKASRKPRSTSALSQATLADATRRAAARRAASRRHLEQSLAEISKQSRQQKAAHRYWAKNMADDRRCDPFGLEGEEQ